MDSKAQIAIEYLLIFFISMILLSIISIPFVIEEVDTLNDIKTTMEVKNTLNELSHNIEVIYSSDYGSQRIISIKSPTRMNISCKQNSSKYYIYSYVTLSDNTKKWVGVEVPCKITFNNKPNYSYTTLSENWWYYNTEIKWINATSDIKSINIYFK